MILFAGVRIVIILTSIIITILIIMSTQSNYKPKTIAFFSIYIILSCGRLFCFNFIFHFFRYVGVPEHRGGYNTEQ